VRAPTLPDPDAPAIPRFQKLSIFLKSGAAMVIDQVTEFEADIDPESGEVLKLEIKQHESAVYALRALALDSIDAIIQSP
jgi:hypothetical protein